MKKHMIAYLSILSAMLISGCSNQPSVSSISSIIASSVSSSTSSSESSSIVSSESSSAISSDKTAKFPSYFTDKQKAYYSGVEGLKSSSLKNKLHDIISSVIVPLTYTASGKALYTIDADPDNSSNVIEIYTQQSVPIANNMFGNNLGWWNREHVFPQSRGNSFGRNTGIGSDCYNIHASDYNVNSKRGNMNFYEFNSGDTYQTGIVSRSKYVDRSKYNAAKGFEPIDEAKGDCARSCFYMEVMYPNKCLLSNTTSQTSSTELGQLNFLVDWNTKDSVSDFEAKRNEKVYFCQKNRNPFIDAPEWVSLIWNSQGLIG